MLKLIYFGLLLVTLCIVIEAHSELPRTVFSFNKDLSRSFDETNNEKLPPSSLNLKKSMSSNYFLNNSNFPKDLMPLSTPSPSFPNSRPLENVFDQFSNILPRRNYGSPSFSDQKYSFNNWNKPNKFNNLQKNKQSIQDDFDQLFKQIQQLQEVLKKYNLPSMYQDSENSNRYQPFTLGKIAQSTTIIPNVSERIDDSPVDEDTNVVEETINEVKRSKSPKSLEDIIETIIQDTGKRPQRIGFIQNVRERIGDSPIDDGIDNFPMKCCIEGSCQLLREGEQCFIDVDGEVFELESIPRTKSYKSKPSKLLTSLEDEKEDSSLPTTKQQNMNNNVLAMPAGSGANKNKSMFQNNKNKISSVGLSEDVVEKIRSEVLKRTNYYRNMYGVKELTMNNQLNNYSQDWANNLANTGTFGHRKEKPVKYGENIFKSSELKNLGTESVDSWYNEIIYYNPKGDEEETFLNFKIRHMTQLLWKNSEKLGVGVSKGSNNMYYVVCNYDPAGNFGGMNDFKNNLPEITQMNVDNAQVNGQGNRKLNKSNSKRSFKRQSSRR